MPRMIAAGALAGATIAACFSAPARPGNGDGGTSGDGTTTDGIPDDALRDGPMSSPDGSPLSCQFEKFFGTGSNTCGISGWGMQTAAGSGIAYLSGTGTGELNLTTYGSAGGFVNCTSATMAWSRIIVDVEAVAATASDDRTFVGLQSADGTQRWGIEFSELAGGPGYTTMCDDGSTQSRDLSPWLQSTQRYIKIERTALAEISIAMGDTASSFTEVESCAPQASVLDTTAAQLRVFTGNVASMGSATATFGSIELCHD
jgi:hypothetical protein